MISIEISARQRDCTRSIVPGIRSQNMETDCSLHSQVPVFGINKALAGEIPFNSSCVGEPLTRLAV
jgi:hypothetical protein